MTVSRTHGSAHRISISDTLGSGSTIRDVSVPSRTETVWSPSSRARPLRRACAWQEQPGQRAGAALEQRG